MKEVEVKARIRDRATFLAALEGAGITLGPPTRQEDRIYAEPDVVVFPAVHAGKNFLRIRIQGERIIFTLKSPVTGHQDKIEYEVDVTDADEMDRLIRQLHFYEYVRVGKTRQIAHAGGYELCLDEIDGVGTFVEVEKLVAEDADSLAIQEELFQFLETLGINRADRELMPYDLLVWQLRNNLASESSDL